jgi:hypothetical protein
MSMMTALMFLAALAVIVIGPLSTAPAACASRC